MNISIIIPNYNGEKLLHKNLPKVLAAVRQYKKGKVEIIIPDDPSTDNSKEVIASFIASIKDSHIIAKTIENKNKNEAGFAKNVNRGVSLATGDMLILLNSDVAPHETFLEPSLKHFEDEKMFGVAFMDESIENNKVVLRGRGIGSWKRGFLIHQAGDVKKNNTLWVSGGSGIFRRSIWEKLKGLDPLYNPFYWEDIDISYRALKSGYKLYFEKDSIVTHEHEKGVIRTKFRSSHIKKIAYRNQFIFVWKNITQQRLLISHLFWLPYHFIKAIRNKDLAFFSGFFLALLLLPKIIDAKATARRIFVKSDLDVMKEFQE